MSYDIDGKNPLYSGYFVRVYEGMFGHEVVVAKDSVAFLVYVQDRDVVVFVRQRRAPMVSDENPGGFITETPAGRFSAEDEKLTARELMIKEGLEELGATIRPDQIHLFNDGIPVAVSPGASTEKMTFGLATISWDQIEQKERTFGVDADEEITRVFVPTDDLRDMVFEDSKTMLLVNLFFTRQQ